MCLIVSFHKRSHRAHLMATQAVGAGMNRQQTPGLPNHEVLAQLARDDPNAYEALRREVIEGFIDSAPERLKPRLSGIQFHVDGLRRLSRSSALGSTVKIYGLMWESFERLNQVWQDFRLDPAQQGSTPATKCVPKQSAQVLHIRPRAVCDRRGNPARTHELRHNTLGSTP